MRRTVSTLALGVAAAVVIGAIATNCGSDTTAPKNKTYVANLNPAAESTAVTTTGTGTATFVDLGSEIDWTLDLTNMTGVTLSHIHLGDVHAVAPNAGHKRTVCGIDHDQARRADRKSMQAMSRTESSAYSQSLSLPLTLR